MGADGVRFEVFERSGARDGLLAAMLVIAVGLVFIGRGEESRRA
jgi:hypothetical protein